MTLDLEHYVYADSSSDPETPDSFGWRCPCGKVRTPILPTGEEAEFSLFAHLQHAAGGTANQRFYRLTDEQQERHQQAVRVHMQAVDAGHYCESQWVGVCEVTFAALCSLAETTSARA